MYDGVKWLKSYWSLIFAEKINGDGNWPKKLNGDGNWPKKINGDGNWEKYVMEMAFPYPPWTPP